MYIQRLIGGDRPRGGSPDHAVARQGYTIFLGQRRQAESRRQFGVFNKRKTDVNGRVALVFIFDLGIRQRGTAVKTPVDRAQATVGKAFFQYFPQGA